MGDLDGFTILRYGHAYDGGGGMEQYLGDLRRALHARSGLHSIHVQLTSRPERVGRESAEENHGGTFTRVSLYVDQESHERAIAGSSHHVSAARRIRNRLLLAPAVYPLLTRRLLARRRPPRRHGEPVDAGRSVAELCDQQKVDLICLHSAGGADTHEILDAAQVRRIPVAYVHHFSNDRLDGFTVRAQLARMQGVAGVCGVDVPRYLRPRFQNLADGIDTEFFRRDQVSPEPGSAPEPVIFLPARVTPTKGQAELIRAAGTLAREGIPVRLAFAGRVDDPAFATYLESLIREEGLSGRVAFLGQLDQAGLRAAYASARALGFPTRHHEGLPRTLLECQAMGLPPVVHDIGGTREGLINGETGFLVSVGDHDGLVGRLRELVLDDVLQARMAAAGRQFVERQFSLPALAARHEAFYRSAAATNRPTRERLVSH